MRFPKGNSARVLMGAAFCWASFAGPASAQDTSPSSLPLLAQAQDPISAAAALQTFVPAGAPDTSATSSEVTTTSIERSLGPAGDPFGVRAALRKRGIEFNFTYVAETLGNTTGGFKRGATFDGRLDGEFNIDLEKLAGLKGMALHTNFYQIHGRGLSTHNLMDLYTISGIEALPDTKLYEAWVEQKLFNDKVAVALGQFASDVDFIVSQTASVFVNSNYGFPAIYSNNLPSGGVSYPFAAPGIRARFQPSNSFTFISALYDGDPAHTDRNGDLTVPPRVLDRGGVNFRLKDPPLFLNEAQFSYNQDKKTAAGLPGVLKIGYLHHFDKFTLFDASPGVAMTVRGNDGAYALLDQSIYKEPGSEQGASIFLRILGAPRDRNLINFQLDGGIAYQGLLPGRDDDTVGISATYTRISPDVTQLDIASGSAPLIRSYQAQIEATYQYVVTNGFTVQPDIQYVIRPGANGVADPFTGQPLRNALVFGLRSTLVY